MAPLPKNDDRKMSLIPEDGVIRAPHILVTIALPTDGSGLDDIPAMITVGDISYLRVPHINIVGDEVVTFERADREYIGVVTACEVLNDDRSH